MTSQGTSERLIFCTRTHWAKYVTNAIKNHVFALLGLTLLAASSTRIIEPVVIVTLFSGTIILLYAHHHFFHKLLSESMYDIFLTTERIIYFDDRLFLSNNEHEIPLHRVAGIEVKQQGLIQNIFNYGTLWIDTGGSAIDFKRCVPFVPRPEELSEKIAQIIHKENPLSHNTPQ